MLGILCLLFAIAIAVFIVRRFCIRGRRKRRDEDGEYDRVALGDPVFDDADPELGDVGDWVSYDQHAVDWDPEQVRVKRRLNAAEAKQQRLQRKVDKLDLELSRRRRELQDAESATSRLTSRLSSAQHDLIADAEGLEEADARGAEMFGEQWSQGSNGMPPLRTLLSLKPDELKTIRDTLEKKRRNKSKQGNADRHPPSALTRVASAGLEGTPTVESHDADEGPVGEEYEEHSELLSRTSLLTEQLRSLRRSAQPSGPRSIRQRDKKKSKKNKKGKRSR